MATPKNLRLIGAAVAAAAALALLFRTWSSDTGGPRGFVYDLSAGRLFEGPIDAIPPVAGVDGPDADGYRAVIVSVSGKPEERSSWRVAYLGAPNDTAIDSALAAFRSGQTAEGWAGHGTGGFNAVQPRAGTPLDMRLVEWQPSGGGELQQLLAQASEETGVYLSAPNDWSPQIEKIDGGRMGDAMPALFRQAGGTSREVFLLRGPAPDEPRGDDDGGWRGNRSWVGAPPARAAGRERGSRDWGNPEATAKRTEAQIKLLPPEEQKEAREDTTMMREFWQSVRELPEEQRRAKAREFFTRPEVQERMEDRRLAREAKMTPQQRIDRSQRYWDRKAEAKYRGGGEQ
jgi:hypothetical protein